MDNHHCSVVTIEDQGILIEGNSGAGKTSLALGLLERAKLFSSKAGFVTDDQAFLQEQNGSIIAYAPESIAGKIEIRGFGISEIAHTESCRIDLVVRLVPDEQIVRMPSPQRTELIGIELPLLNVPIRHEQQASRIVFAWLDHASF